MSTYVQLFKEKIKEQNVNELLDKIDINSVVNETITDYIDKHTIKDENN